MNLMRWRRRGMAAVAVIGLAAGAQLVTAAPASAAPVSQAGSNVSCYAAGGSGGVGCVRVYGDVVEIISGTHSGSTLSLHWGWGMNTAKVTAFYYGAFVFSVADCTAGRWVWQKSYSYSKGTSLRHVTSSGRLQVTAGHRYLVQVRAYGTYQRRFSDGSKGAAYISASGGRGGQVVARGACV